MDVKSSAPSVVRMALAAAIVSALYLSAFAQQSYPTIDFTVSCPTKEMAPFLGSACTIFAAGEIDLDAGRRLDAFLQANRVPANSRRVTDSLSREHPAQK
jgi:hypothetical protein